MEPEEMDGQEVLETPELELEETPELDEKDQKLADLEAKNKQLFERAKKAEELAKGKVEPSKDNNLSTKDQLALVQAQVRAEDLDEVVRIAKVLGLPVSDALNNSTMKTILEARAEERRTAAATMTRGGARGTTATPEDILKKAELTGEVPSDDAGMKQLAEARLARRKAQASH